MAVQTIPWEVPPGGPVPPLEERIALQSHLPCAPALNESLLPCTFRTDVSEKVTHAGPMAATTISGYKRLGNYVQGSPKVIQGDTDGLRESSPLAPDGRRKRFCYDGSRRRVPARPQALCSGVHRRKMLPAAVLT